MKAAGNAQQLPFERVWHIETRPAENRPPYLPPRNNMAARPRRDLPTNIFNWNRYVSIVIKDFPTNLQWVCIVLDVLGA